MGGVTYPAIPLQEVQPRPISVYSQVSSTCSPSASFSGPFNPAAGGVVPPQPHSSYYSGMAGPQHPFYNRVSAGPAHWQSDDDITPRDPPWFSITLIHFHFCLA